MERERENERGERERDRDRDMRLWVGGRVAGEWGCEEGVTQKWSTRVIMPPSPTSCSEGLIGRFHLTLEVPLSRCI